MGSEIVGGAPGLPVTNTLPLRSTATAFALLFHPAGAKRLCPQRHARARNTVVRVFVAT